MRRNDALAILKSCGWLAQIEPRLASAVLQAGRLLHVSKGDFMYHPGDDPGGMYGVVKGGIVMSALGRDGLPVAGHIMRQCDWFGYTSALDLERRWLMSVANEPSLVLHVPLAEMISLREGFPSANHGFGRLSTLGEILYIAIVADLLISNTDRRLAAILLRVTGAATPERLELLPVDPLVDLWASPDGVPLTQGLLAELANASTHTVSRFVDRCVDANWIGWKYRRVRILDRAALSAFASGKSPSL